METLQSFTERFRELFEILSDGVVVWRLDGTIVACNDAMAVLTGYPVDELPGMNIARLLTADDVQEVTERQQQQIKGEAVSQRYELRLIRKDGTEVVGEVVTRLLSDGDKPRGVLAIVKNVTEQKRFQRAILEERDKAQRYLDVAGMAIQVIDANEKAILFNRKCCDIFGYEEWEVIGDNWFETFIPERNLGLAKAVFRKLISGEMSPGRCLESPVVTKSGEERIMAWYNTTVLNDETGHAVAVLGSGEDVTEQKQMEKALRESEERYRTLFEDSRDAICIITREGKIVDVNQAALDLFGYDQDEILGLDVTNAEGMDIVGARAFRGEIEKRGFVRDHEMKLLRKDGAEIDCLLTFSVRRDSDGKILRYEGIIRDVTERKRLEQNRQLYIMQITKAQEEERKRISRELHDETIQGLAVLSLDVEEIMRARKRSSHVGVKRLAQIQDRVNHIAEELSRLSHALRPSVLDQLGLMPALKLLVRDLRKADGVSTKLDVVGKERRLLPEVELGLFRIVQEALRNVEKHSGASTAVVTLQFDSDVTKVTVVDDGKGFELPKRLGDFTATGQLGLVGMQERSQLLNGRLWVQSELGRGTTVTVEVENHL